MGDGFEGNLSGVVDVCAVGDADVGFDSDVSFFVEVGDITGGERAVGDEDGAVVVSLDEGLEDLDFFDGSYVVLGLDAVADIKWAKYK